MGGSWTDSRDLRAVIGGCAAAVLLLASLALIVDRDGDARARLAAGSATTDVSTELPVVLQSPAPQAEIPTVVMGVTFRRDGAPLVSDTDDGPPAASIRRTLPRTGGDDPPDDDEPAIDLPELDGTDLDESTERGLGSAVEDLLSTTAP